MEGPSHADPTDDLPSIPDLSDEEIEEFRRLLKEETGEDLSPGEARLRASELIRLRAPDQAEHPFRTNVNTHFGQGER
jgi:hypothetical protein